MQESEDRRWFYEQLALLNMFEGLIRDFMQEHQLDLTVLGDMKKGFSFIVSSPTDLIAQDPESILDKPEGGLRILSNLKELTHDENEFRIEPYGISFFKSSENECLAGISLQNLNEALKYAWENLDNKG